jgi:hypothetical protein
MKELSRSEEEVKMHRSRQFTLEKDLRSTD